MSKSAQKEGSAAPTPGMSAPTAGEQRRVIASLEEEEESTHVYVVSKSWYAKWQNYVGLGEKELKGAKETQPGSIRMDRDEEKNMYVDEKIWKRWVDWYGVSSCHELDRRNWASDDKDFEICILSPYSGIVENPIKTFDISEETGYIELQLRKIFRVATHRKTRLWSCEKARNARFHLMTDRSKEICIQEGVDNQKDYILAIELSNLDGSWPTHVPGEPKGSFERYRGLSDSPKKAEFWEHELAKTVETVFSGISNELKETVEGVVVTSKCVTQMKEQDMDVIAEKLSAKVKLADDTQSSLDGKSRELQREEESLRADKAKLKKCREHFDRERGKFTDEVKKLESMNKINEHLVKLNIGGTVYQTSVQTVTKDPDSMLAVMFSGRHQLKREGDGSYFIDRDGTHFRFILNYLRDGGFKHGTLPSDRGFLTELQTEAEFYQISGLKDLIADVLRALPGESPPSTHKQKRSHRKVAMMKHPPSPPQTQTKDS